MSEIKVSNQIIENYLQGQCDEKFIVSVETTYYQNIASLVINDPKEGKYIKQVTFKPFLWFKHDVSSILYGGKRVKIIDAMRKHKVKISELRTSDNEGKIPERMANGYKYIAKCDESYNSLLKFFKEGGIDIFSEEYRKYFMTCSPTEQFLIQTGRRMFKGFEEYDEIHRLQFDLETTGLLPESSSIFQIGIKDNRGYERVLEVKGENEYERRNSERLVIYEFFRILNDLQPDLISGYNSENFDWNFIDVRCSKLGIDITEAAITLNDSKISRRKAQVKYGGEVEHYTQTYMWGTNIIDIMHSVRRAMAINSEIKEFGLKYITKFSKIAKPNRVYVPGDKIFKTWADEDGVYYFNEENGDWFLFNKDNPNHIERISSPTFNMLQVKGSYIVERYLLDDLWETEKIDERFNQATFLIGKLVPTSYMKNATMGTAGIWKLIMMGWSYENNLAIPALQEQQTFTGGLSRLLSVGYARNVAKLDYAALYPNIELTHDIFPDIDISGVLKGMLLYIAETRDTFKALKGEHGDNAKVIKASMDSIVDKTSKEYLNLFAKYEQEKSLEDKYDKKQLPVKILANSFFGSYGAPHLFPWGDIECAEETTCRGRQYLRLMVSHFHEKHGFKPLVGDTDGFNFEIPDDVDKFKYTVTGTHRLTEYMKGKTISGLKAVVAEFNEVYMEGRMGLDIDDICTSTINFARKNYANDIGGKIKLVGNSIKSKKMPKYIEEFLDVGIRLLLDGKGSEFIDLYYKTADSIVNYEVPIAKIASKSKVKLTVDGYKKKMAGKTEKGNTPSRQAHMELIIKHNLNVNVGDTIYYVNTGETKSQGDLKAHKDKETGKVISVDLMCKLIPQEDIDFDPNFTSEDYNAPKYLAAFNKRIKPLLVCFHPDIRDMILLDFKKDRKLKEYVLSDKNYFTNKQCELTSGFAYKPEDQDDYVNDLMKMEDKEIFFWTKYNKLPNNIDLNEWELIKEDYFARMIILKAEETEMEKKQFENVIRRFELEDLYNFHQTGKLPVQLEFLKVEFNDEDDSKTKLISAKWETDITYLTEIFKYVELADERYKFYTENPTKSDYYSWILHKSGDERSFTELMANRKTKKLKEEAKELLNEMESNLFDNLIIPKQILEKKDEEVSPKNDDEWDNF